MNTTISAFSFQMESNQVLNDLVYAKRRLDRMLSIINEPGVPEEDKYKAIAEMIWEACDYLDWNPI
jgi:hypothetical protein